MPPAYANFRTPDFNDLYFKLPAEVKRAARNAYEKFQADPYQNGLRFKKLSGYDDVYSVRISLGYRAVGLVDGNQIDWFWIGSKADFEREFC